MNASQNIDTDISEYDEDSEETDADIAEYNNNSGETHEDIRTPGGFKPRETTLEKYKRKLPRTPFTLLTTPKLKHEPVKTQYV